LKQKKNTIAYHADKTNIMRKCITPLFLFFYLLITLLGCYKKHTDSKCLSFAKAPVIKVEGANSAMPNQEVTLTVSFGCHNGCGQFGNFDETIISNVTTIIVNAKYEGCTCTHNLPIRQSLYKFKKSQAGRYDLRFWQTENTYLTHTIIVQ
jgi:hypothetical protein